MHGGVGWFSDPKLHHTAKDRFIHFWFLVSTFPRREVMLDTLLLQIQRLYSFRWDPAGRGGLL
jgi:hypothetical protein